MKQINIWNIVNLMVDMVENGATKDELKRIIEHSKNVIDGNFSNFMYDDIDYLENKYSHKESDHEK